MNTYDPADRIRYVHTPPEPAASASHPEDGRRCTRLPAGYANGSPHTSLRQRRSRPRSPAPGPAAPPFAETPEMPARAIAHVPA